MASSIPTVSLSAARGTQLSPISTPPRLSSPSSSSFPVRAPLSSDDNGSDAETLTSTDEDFETASDPDDELASSEAAAPLPWTATVRPIAQLTGDDDVSEDDEDEDDDVFEDGLSDVEEDFPAVARVPSVDQDAILAMGEGVDGEMFDPSQELGDSPADGVLGVEDGEAQEFDNLVGNSTAEEVVGAEENDSVVSGGYGAVDGVEENGAERIGAADVADSDQNCEPVSLPAAQTLELESSKSNLCISESESVDFESAVGSVSNSDSGDGDKAIIESMEIGSQAVMTESEHFSPAEDSADGVLDVEDTQTPELEYQPENPNKDEIVGAEQIDYVVSCDGVVDGVEENGVSEEARGPCVERAPEAIDMTDPPNQEIGGQALMTESEHTIDLETEPGVPLPELAADGGDSVSVHEAELPPILADESESRETIGAITETLSMAGDGNSGLVSGESLTSEPVSCLEEKTVADAPESTADGGDSVLVQEAESPAILAEESESTETESNIRGNSIMAGDGNSAVVSDENLTSEPVSGPEEKTIAVDGCDSVSVQEMELPPILPEESESRETEIEIRGASSMSGSGSSALVSREILIPESVSGLEEKSVADMPELAADGGKSVSVHGMESPPILAEEFKSRETEREITETLNMAGGGDSAVVSGETLTPATISALEEKTVADVSELPADGGDPVSIHEVESLPSFAEDSESRGTKREITEPSSMALDGNSVEVSGVTLTSESVSGFEERTVADACHESDDDDTEIMDPNTTEEEEEDSVSEGPARVAILESSEAKQIMEELEEGSSGTSTPGFGSLLNYSRNIDEQIASDSDEDAMDSDEEGNGKDLFDSAALAALLRAATGVSSDGSISIASPDGTRIFSVDRPAGLGSSIPSLKPAPARLAQSNLRTSSDLAVSSEPVNNMDEEERKLHEKVEMIRVKFLLLVQRLGHSPEDTMAAKVLYNLNLAEEIRCGRQISRVFSLENARKKVLELERNGKDNLDFSCTILILGKIGVGKSATVNSIFGEEKSHTNAFEQATASVKEIVGVVDGVKIRVIDTPGLKASVMDQASNRRILSSVKKHTERSPPDIVLYVDRMDTQTRDSNDLPLLRSITTVLGSSIWINAIVALTHAASAPPDGSNGSPLSYDMFVAQRSHVVQHSIRQAVGDMRLMNLVTLVENHPSCRRNVKGEKVLPNGLSWKPEMLLLCYSSKILSEANSLLKLQEPSPAKLFGFRLRSPPLAYFLSSLLQSRSHPKLLNDQGGDNGDSDVDLDDLLDADQEEEDEYDVLPPFKPLRKSQIAKLTKEQRKAYFDEYDYRVKLLQKKQWKEELRRLKEMKKRGKGSQDDFGYAGYADMAEDFDQDNVPAEVSVPLPDRVLPPSFDCDYPVYRYRVLETTPQLLIQPVLDLHGWDHDCGYDRISLEHNLAVVGRFPAGVSVQVRKDKKEFNIHLDSSISAKHGENVSTLTGFDIQSIGKQLAYILRTEARFKNLKKNKTAAGISITFLGETVATGLKIEDQLSVGKRVSLVASTGAVRAQGDVAYGTNLEATLRDKDYPLGQSISTLALSLLSWRGELALGGNLQSQFSVGRNSKMALRVGLNNKMSGQITITTSSSDHLQIALAGILPIAISIYRSIWPGESIPY